MTPEKAQMLGRERANLEAIVTVIKSLDSSLADAADLLELARDEDDTATIDAIEVDLDTYEDQVSSLEFPPHVFG